MKKMVMVEALEEWELIKKNSKGDQVVLLKFSPFCAASHMSRRLFDRWFEGLDKNEKILCIKIDVVGSRKLSNAIAKEFSVIHQSPQVIWLDHSGKVKWHNSHFRITEEALSNQLINTGIINNEEPLINTGNSF